MKKKILFMVAILIVLGGAGCKQGKQGGDTQKTAVDQGIQSKVLEIPKEILDKCIGFVIGGEEEIALAKKIGAGWVRPHPGPFAWGEIEKTKGNYNFIKIDAWVKKAQDNDIAILATIWPFSDWDQISCHKEVDCAVSSADLFYPDAFGFGIPKWRCAPCDMEAYRAFLVKLVERYDGDGQDDMPGLKIPIRYFEILNEPEMKESFLTFYKGTGEEYIAILKNSSEVIKETCPECKIVQGGAAGVEKTNLSYWGKIFDLGGADYFDVANIHYINFSDLSSLNVNSFKSLLKQKNVEKPVWVTEAEYRMENQVEKSVGGAITAGAEKIFFTQFKIGEFGMPQNGAYSKIYEQMPLKCK